MSFYLFIFCFKYSVLNSVGPHSIWKCGGTNVISTEYSVLNISGMNGVRDVMLDWKAMSWRNSFLYEYLYLEAREPH